VSADRATTITVTQGAQVVATVDLTAREAMDFVLLPAAGAVDDGEASWELQESNFDRLNEIAEFVNNARDGVAEGLT